MIADEIKSYIEASFNDDSTISDKPSVQIGYRYESEPKQNIIVIETLDDVSDITSMLGVEFTSNISVQITCLCKQQKINGKTMSAQQSCSEYSERIRKLMFPSNLMASIADIASCRRSGMAFSMPYKEGSKYYVAPIRYSMKIKQA
jgi:hypothetical protein